MSGIKGHKPEELGLPSKRATLLKLLPVEGHEFSTNTLNLLILQYPHL